jgi:hypothetical protein
MLFGLRGVTVFLNVQFAGCGPLADEVKALLSVSDAEDVVVQKRVFTYARSVIVGCRKRTSSTAFGITSPWFGKQVHVQARKRKEGIQPDARSREGAGILNPGHAWLVEACTFERTSEYWPRARSLNGRRGEQCEWAR